jgi:hypothetical protein
MLLVQSRKSYAATQKLFLTCTVSAVEFQLLQRNIAVIPEPDNPVGAHSQGD